MNEPLQPPPAIQLTPDEQRLLGRIDFDSSPGAHDVVIASLEASAALAKSLLDRSAIPEIRIRYFTDPECNPGGRGKSKKEIFERNGTAGDEIFRHPHFLKFLRYFIFGPDLPTEAITAFCASIWNYLSGGDVQDLVALAKKSVRRYSLDPREAAEEYFKLALECKAMPSSADRIRRQIRSMRSGRSA